MENESKIEYRFGLDGSQRWFLDGLYHNDEGPSIIYAGGTKCWHKDGIVTGKQIGRAHV